VNLPWVNYVDFGANAWHPDGGLAREPWRSQALAAVRRLADCGAQVVRWWVLGDGRAGIVWDAHGHARGLDAAFFDDLDTAVEMVAGLGLRMLPVLLDALWCQPGRMVDGVLIGGRRAVLRHAEPRGHLLERVIEPILARYGSHPAVLAWDVINEPDLVTRGCWPSVPPTALAPEPMRDFIAAAVERVHGLTAHAATVGLGNARHLPLVRDLGLDLYQVHWYDVNDRWSPLDTAVGAWGLDAPILLGEFPTRRSRRQPLEVERAARRAGYVGALAWSLLAADEFTDGAACAAFLAGSGSAPG
jgi:hypothetical protein